jgi:lipopolysaccharide export system protein LptC
MTNPMIRIHNIQTNEIIDREMTTAEFVIYENEQKIAADRESKIEAKETARTALLQRLGISEEEAELLK